MSTQARKDSQLAYYQKNREVINAKRRERAKTAAGDKHRADALGHFYANRQEANRKRTQRFVRDRIVQGWGRETKLAEAGLFCPPAAFAVPHGVRRKLQ